MRRDRGEDDLGMGCHFSASHPTPKVKKNRLEFNLV
jgi:hypothetical protein